MKKAEEAGAGKRNVPDREQRPPAEPGSGRHLHYICIKSLFVVGQA
jgi:hypothetical protein